MEFFGSTAGCSLFDHKKTENILDEMKVDPVDEKLKKVKIKLATICNKNEQQQDGKINAEF